MVEQQRVQLDHIVILLPHRDLLDPPAWITSNFNLSPGGRHADGKTENKLVVFQDGTYIELISFVGDSAANRDGHWWGDKRYGVIDWALTSSNVRDAGWVEARLDGWRSKYQSGALTDFSYAQPQRGGRCKPDGQEIAWLVTFPQGVKRGLVPFWCHDVTARGLRVAANAQSLRHPCGATGISSISVHTPDSARLRGAYDAILAQPGKAADHVTSEWVIETPQFLTDRSMTTVFLRSPVDDPREYDREVNISIELAIDTTPAFRQSGPVDEALGPHGEGHIMIAFSEPEQRGPR